jgi:hypothetical protein
VKLELGQIVATRGAMKDFGLAMIADLLDRHARGDWGDLDHHDIRANNQALRTGARLLSAYETPAGRVWIITESDRSSTCVLSPEEY